MHSRWPSFLKVWVISQLNLSLPLNLEVVLVFSLVVFKFSYVCLHDLVFCDLVMSTSTRAFARQKGIELLEKEKYIKAFDTIKKTTRI